MAVTITQAELSAALRLGTSTEEIAEATRLLTYATEAVTQHAEHAPDAVQNEATIRLAGISVRPTVRGPRRFIFQRASQFGRGADASALPHPSRRVDR